MTFADTHTHIYLSDFENDREQMIERAVHAGVKACLLPAIDRSEHTNLLNLCQKYPTFCFPMMGLHPCSVKENYKEELNEVYSLLTTRKFYGIGEIGLDFYWDKTFVEEQKEAFFTQLEWASHFKLPVSIHSRNALDDCIQIVKYFPKGTLSGVFHCFAGNERQAKEITEYGFYLGIGGVATYKNAGLDATLKHIAPGFLVLETDAPYLTPVPFRGKRNEPAYLKYVAEKIAMIKNITVEEVAEITTRNAQKIFGI
ncbi:MAG: TatD family hydrolase [Chitinophagaceae bacterium]|nr:TatD family hydrolase [Chitinophagaceae bacterium]